ncbi:MAG: hypothetical protein F4X41_00385 [Chloroflexi bacterium]|nr:hypothetical protein [Chloroflexota bacterium]
MGRREAERRIRHGRKHRCQRFRRRFSNGSQPSDISIGYSLERHAAAVFRGHCLKYDRYSVTESINKPDFPFTGIDARRAVSSG